MRAKSFVVLFLLVSTAAFAQQGQGQRGAVGALPGQGGQRGAPPVILGPPQGVQQLPLDLFMSKNFYKDKDLWMNKYYYRCNPAQQLSEIWNQRRIGMNPPTSASWGDCNDDLTRESILSPYPYMTAKQHYAA